MGMFDSVWVKCPHCDERTEIQSKAGKCDLISYELEDAPEEVITDLALGGGYRYCHVCHKEIVIVPAGKPYPTVRKPKEDWE